MNSKVKTVISARNAVSGNVRGILVRMGRSASLAAGALLLGGALLMGGCSKESDDFPVGPSEGEGLVEISFSPESMGEVSIDSRALSAHPDAVRDLWVIQLNSTGTAQLQDPQFFPRVNNQVVKVKTKYQSCRLYCIANTGNATLFNGVTTDADVQAKTLSVMYEWECAPEQYSLPMSGFWTGTPTTSGMSIELQRAVAKVIVMLAADIPNGNSFDLTSVKVKNVPSVLHYFRDPSTPDPGTTAASCYPPTSVGFIDEWYDMSPSYDKTLGAQAKECGWCYLPENARGSGSATDQRNKTAATALGGALGQGNYATYIEITGDYTNDVGYKYVGNTYRIYLGADAVKDYNVKRNTVYTVTATIKGMDALDARITVGSCLSSPDVYDYTDNATGRVLYAKSDASNGSAMAWKNALLACAETPGWRLPTLTELNIINCMRDTWEFTSNGFSNNYYATATIDTATGKAYFLNFNSGLRSDMNDARVRCVREL